MATNLNDEQVYENLCAQVSRLTEVLSFARKFSMLELYLETEHKLFVLNRAAQIIKIVLDNRPTSG